LSKQRFLVASVHLEGYCYNFLLRTVTLSNTIAHLRLQSGDGKKTLPNVC
jgi:hypothetical protein